MTNKSLKWFNNEYEKVLHSVLSDKDKDMQYAALMSEMEQAFNIPMLKNEAWEKENKAVIALYRKISMSRKH